MAKLNPALTGQGRVFINVDGEGCGKTYTYYNCMKVDGLDKSLGDITSIYCPDPNQYDTFIEVSSIKGTDSRFTSTLSGKWPIDSQSPLEELLNQGCPFSLQVHYGRCTRPDSFTEFESALIITDARLTNYSLSTLTAISPDERAAIDETAAFSAANAYRIFAPSFANVATTLVATATIQGITHADSKSCGGICATRSDGCQVWIARQGLNFLYTTDGGVTWTQTLTNSAADTAGNNFEQLIYSIGSYVYTTRFTAGLVGEIIATPLSSIVTDNAATPTVISSIANALYSDFDSSDSYVWAVGRHSLTGDGIIAVIDRSSHAVTQLAPPTLAVGLRSIDALDDDNVLIGYGNGGRYAYSTSFGIFTDGTIPGVAGSIYDVKMINESNWIAYATGVGFYCTANSGKTWKLVRAYTDFTFPKMAFYDNIVGYVQLSDGIYRTLDSGNTWTKIYSNTNATIVLNMQVCPYNPNIVYSAGGNNAADSFITKGSI